MITKNHDVGLMSMKLREQEPRSDTFVEAIPGFSKRLNSILKSLDTRKHGQFQKLSEWSELSNSGARNFFIQDRPPKRENFTSLVNGIIKETWDKHNFKLNKTDLEKYLLKGGESPLSRFSKTEEERRVNFLPSANQQFNSLGYNIVETDPKDVSTILEIVATVANEKGINFVHDLSVDQRTQLLLKCIELYVIREVEIKSLKMKTLVSTLMVAASEQLL